MSALTLWWWLSQVCTLSLPLWQGLLGSLACLCRPSDALAQSGRRYYDVRRLRWSLLIFKQTPSLAALLEHLVAPDNRHRLQERLR